MQNTIKAVPFKIKNHVVRHKAAYAMGVVAVAAIALQQRNLKQYNAFLVEKGIDPMEYYNPEYYAELNA